MSLNSISYQYKSTFYSYVGLDVIQRDLPWHVEYISDNILTRFLNNMTREY